jgi:hypothetical protein
VKFGSDGLHGMSGPERSLNASILEDRVATDVELPDLKPNKDSGTQIITTASIAHRQWQFQECPDKPTQKEYNENCTL